jgi:hypothetical protein
MPSRIPSSGRTSIEKGNIAARLPGKKANEKTRGPPKRNHRSHQDNGGFFRIKGYATSAREISDATVDKKKTL